MRLHADCIDSYLIMFVFAILALRRQRKTEPSLYRKDISLCDTESRPQSLQFSEMDGTAYTAQTLPSRPATVVPSRQISLAARSTRPPTYYSSGDESLLVVDEKDTEKERTKGLRGVGWT